MNFGGEEREKKSISYLLEALVSGHKLVRTFIVTQIISYTIFFSIGTIDNAEKK